MQFKLDHRGLKPSVNHNPLVHGKRDDGSHVVDAVLKRDPTLRLPPGFDQYLSVPRNVHSPPAHPRSRIVMGAGLKGWEDMEVDNVKPQEIVSSLPLVTA